MRRTMNNERNESENPGKVRLLCGDLRATSKRRNKNIYGSRNDESERVMTCSIADELERIVRRSSTSNYAGAQRNL